MAGWYRSTRDGRGTKSTRSQEDQTNVRRLHVLRAKSVARPRVAVVYLAAPVVEIILQAAIADSELELRRDSQRQRGRDGFNLLENLLVVVKDVQGVEHIKVKLLGDDESFRHQLPSR